jgi:HSP20 family protein
MSTTDVFVVTDNFLSTTTSGTLTGTATTNTLYTGGYFGTPTTLTISGASTVYNIPQTYNEFWNFDEKWDIFWKSFFDKNSVFKPISEKAVNHPCDVQETDNGLKIEIAAVGLDKKDIDLLVDSETLRVAYRKQDDNTESDYRYLHRSIKKASFDIAWKISSKYELSKLEANLDKGLLIIDIPFAKENKPKKIEIK